MWHEALDRGKSLQLVQIYEEPDRHPQFFTQVTNTDVSLENLDEIILNKIETSFFMEVCDMVISFPFTHIHNL
jgi:hypothetical protein